ncbi:radical SAM protein [Spirosoma sp. RP8]|uniref:Radical SAM protein n=1 Tax=Spirosoma liriopis TaxID=2937440 RepID=A0ABT0HT08_9BACT|nr:radical SAM protein [Spirosoma liriopis]MCK8495282.1 radical SAM protein [Spirosoma liriopis]
MIKRRQPRIRGLVLKVASRCNLNCSYCYVYNHDDTTYREQPRLMSNVTVDLLLSRVGDYCRQHRIKDFQFIFHGGEPLLAPISFYQQFVSQVEKSLPSHTHVHYALQTNGVLLTNAWCQSLGELAIRVGISIDGTAAVHDAHRVDHRGRGSYQAVVAGLQKAQEHPAFRYHPGVLVVIDPTTEPETFLKHFVGLNVRSLNLLLPDGTHHKLPPHFYSDRLQTLYGDWLVRLFDAWMLIPSNVRPRIRFFQQIINLILGFAEATEAIGRTRALFLVIETDGSIEAEDSLKVCMPRITKEGMHLRTHSLESALTAPLIAQCAESQRTLPTACRRCPIREVCGGGFFVHRYHPASGFDNPSVYCHDLLKLITHIQNQLLAQLTPLLQSQAKVNPLSYEQALVLLKEREVR